MCSAAIFDDVCEDKSGMPNKELSFRELAKALEKFSPDERCKLQHRDSFSASL